MATIPKPPFKLSLVTDEWKNKSIKACGDKAGLKPPFKCTEFVGKSDRASMTITVGYDESPKYKMVGYSVISGKMGEIITKPVVDGVTWNVDSIVFTTNKDYPDSASLSIRVANREVVNHKDNVILEINSVEISLVVVDFGGSTPLIAGMKGEENKIVEAREYFMANKGKNIDILVEHIKN